MMVHEGPARVFDCEEAAEAAILNGGITAGDVVVIRYEGPKGGPGMREMYKAMKYISNDGIPELVKVLEQGSWESKSITQFSKVLSNIASNLNNLQYNQENLFLALEICKEDSNILSWLVGEWSNDLNIPLTDKIEQSQIAFILGKELADLVTQVPGPYAAKALLKKMLGLCKRKQKDFSLVEMVDLLDKEKKEQILNKYSLLNSGINTPILLSITKALEANEPIVWKHAFKTIMNIDADEVKKEPLTWAYQLYLECLLTKFYYEEE
jgi:hypothetical protein